MLINILFTILGNLIFLFIFWKKLKEDYVSNQIFTVAFYVLIGATSFNIFSRRFFPEWWFWLSFLGMIAGLGLGTYRFRLRIMETLEALVISVLPSMGLIFLAHFMRSSNTQSLFGVLVIILLTLLFIIFDKHYKRFTWYKSGRIGFSGLTILGLFFLLRAAIAHLFPSMLSFSGNYETYLSALVAFIAFLGVFTLARQQT